MFPQPHTFTARWIFPADSPPLPRGTVTIQGTTIVAVESQGRRRADEDLGDVAILPGLVNAHVHLDLTGMRGLCPPTADFAAWLREVVKHRRQRTHEQVEADICAGLAECQRYGTTLVGDIASQGLSWPILEQASLRSVVFWELLGLPADRAEQALEQAASWLAHHADTETCRAGLSPHAPYSVRAELFANVAELTNGDRTLRVRNAAHGVCGHHCMPVAIHLAETRQELELLEHHRGPLAEFLKDVGVWQPEGLVHSTGEITELFQQGPQTLFVHGNYLPPAEIGRATLVYCPRTHAAFGHDPHPFREALALGANVALGTDSLASNPDLDILAEARFLHRRHPELPGTTLLKMLTLNGAAALGWADVAGSLTAGKSADLVVLPLPDEHADDPHRGIFASAEKVCKVMWRGGWL